MNPLTRNISPFSGSASFPARSSTVSAAFKLGPELFRSLGADVIAMGVSPDGRNINAGCGSLHLEGLQKRVVAEKAHLGVAFDGDADRALFVCETGKIVNGDGVLLAAARFLKSQNKLKGD